ncbi:potassium channel family protein [Georgenia sp. 10Sc9-8]|uniref:Potassium channel family protein n=1 Tax=Georgenia halotolerans TaxID=3028317 RepID=A0ABT5U190_9MICO|nr:potassium channel family protein [Georgenia halotolerans]
MDAAVGWVLTAVGVLLVLVALRDVFHTLWHPSGQGSISKTVMVLVWRLSRRFGGRGRQLSGPVGMAAVMGSWGGLIVLGYMLIYWPHLPEEFLYSSGLNADAPGHVVEALYVSVVTVATLGYGDIVPTSTWLRMVSPLQGLIGFALLTAAVSWVLQVYPALNRRRVLALQLSAMEQTRTREALSNMAGTAAARLLQDVSTGIAQARIDLTQYSETYFFRDTSPQTSLALTVGYAHRLAETAQGAAAAEVRQAGAILAASVHDLAEFLDGQFLHTGEDTSAVLSAYGEDQALPS